MDEREQLNYLLEHYYKGNYAIDVFVEEFHRIYNLELDSETIPHEEYSLMGELSVIVGRFSPFEEDLAITNVYFNENDVKKKATEVYLKLKISD